MCVGGCVSVFLFCVQALVLCLFVVFVFGVYACELFVSLFLFVWVLNYIYIFAFGIN